MVSSGPRMAAHPGARQGYLAPLRRARSAAPARHRQRHCAKRQHAALRAESKNPADSHMARVTFLALGFSSG